MPSQYPIHIGHSPDPDDAFMFYGMLHGKVDLQGLEIKEVVEDIESLNERALEGVIEATAVSWHLLATISEKYAVLDPGASMGIGYGPVLVAKGGQRIPFPDLGGRRVALPGPHTTATLLMRILATNFKEVFVPFDRIMGEVEAGAVDAGLLIHEGQITYGEEGFEKVADYGEIWADLTDGLPLPLGTNAVRRDLPKGVDARLARVLLDSIVWGEENRAETNAYAREFGRGLDEEKNDRFIKMYVNPFTLSLGEEGVEGVDRLFQIAGDKGVLPRRVNWKRVMPGS